MSPPAFEFIEQKVAGQKVKDPQAIAVTALVMEKTSLGANGVGGMMHFDRSLM